MSRRKLTENEVRLIRGMYKELGYILRELSEMFGCKECSICQIVNNDTYKDSSYNPAHIPDTPLTLHFEKNKDRFGCDSFDEAYKPIKDFPYYVIGRDGSVWSNYGFHWTKLALRLKRGYNVILLHNNNQLEYIRVHRLLAEAFIPNPDNLPCVLHYNDIRSDNRIENLRWGTQKENSADAIRNGKLKSIPQQIRNEIRQVKKDNPKVSGYALSKHFGVSRKAVYKILKE